MKRLFHLIFIVLTLAVFRGISAQDTKPTPTPKQATEPLYVRMVPLGITMVLGTLKEVEATEQVRMSMVMMAEFFPDKFKDQQDKMVKIAGAERKDQLVLLEELTDDLRAKTSASDKWTVDFGRRWGKTYGKAIQLSKSEFKEDSQPFLTNLRELGEYLETCRKDVPPELLTKLQKITDTYPKEQNFSTGVVVGTFVSASIELIDYLDSLERESPFISRWTRQGSQPVSGRSPCSRAYSPFFGSIPPVRTSFPSALSTKSQALRVLGAE